MLRGGEGGLVFDLRAAIFFAAKKQLPGAQGHKVIINYKKILNLYNEPQRAQSSPRFFNKYFLPQIYTVVLPLRHQYLGPNAQGHRDTKVQRDFSRLCVLVKFCYQIPKA